MASVIGLDIGTSKLCGVVLAADGTPRAVAARVNAATCPATPPGHVEQDPLRIRALAHAVLRELALHATDATALGLTGQMHGMLCVDARNEPTGPLVTWQDGRGLTPLANGETLLSQMLARGGAERWTVCGCMPASGQLGSTLYWYQQQGGVPAGTARVAFIHDWLAAGFVGELPCTDLSDAGGSGICDIERGNWHAPLIAALALPAEVLPPIRPAGAVLGGLTAASAAAVGLAAGLPVCNACGDNQASFLGGVAEPANTVLVNLGTGGQISWAQSRFARVPGLETRALVGVPDAPYMLVGASLCGGRAYAWLADTVQAWVQAVAPASVPASRSDVYAVLNALAAAAPVDCGGLCATTSFAGTRADPDRRGTLAGVDLENFALGNVARAVLTGMVAELAEHYDAARAAGHAPVRPLIVGAGNAVRRNPVLREIIAARFASSLTQPAYMEEAASGAALLAGVASGVFSSAATVVRRRQDASV
jgi:sugar (pentulose or hexulose) kinase